MGEEIVRDEVNNAINCNPEPDRKSSIVSGQHQADRDKRKDN